MKGFWCPSCVLPVSFLCSSRGSSMGGGKGPPASFQCSSECSSRRLRVIFETPSYRFLNVSPRSFAQASYRCSNRLRASVRAGFQETKKCLSGSVPKNVAVVPGPLRACSGKIRTTFLRASTVFLLPFLPTPPGAAPSGLPASTRAPLQRTKNGLPRIHKTKKRPS